MEITNHGETEIQNPKPERMGKFSVHTRSARLLCKRAQRQKTCPIEIAPAAKLERETQKIAAELVRPMNQGLISIGSAVSLVNTCKANTSRPCCHCWQRPRETLTKLRLQNICNLPSENIVCVI